MLDLDVFKNNEEFFAYLAGIVDADGSITICSTKKYKRGI
jgi:hypothetical protein